MYEDENFQIVDEPSEEVIRLFDEADQHFEKGDIEDAEKAYRKVFEYEPVNERALEALSHLYIQQSKYEEAEAVWEQASNYVETQTWFYLGRMARIYEERDMFVDAERILRYAVKKTPYSGMAHAALGAFYEHQGKLLDAMQAYCRAAEAEPEDKWLKSNLERIYALTGWIRMRAAFERSYKTITDIARIGIDVVSEEVQRAFSWQTLSAFWRLVTPEYERVLYFGYEQIEPLLKISPFYFTAVREEPVFKWNAVAEADSYEISLLDLDKREWIGEKIETNETSVSPSVKMERGKKYGWRLHAKKEGEVIDSTTAYFWLLTEAKLEVLSKGESAAMQLFEDADERSLALGVVYAEAQLYEEAIAKYQKVIARNENQPKAFPANKGLFEVYLRIYKGLLEIDTPAAIQLSNIFLELAMEEEKMIESYLTMSH